MSLSSPSQLLLRNEEYLQSKSLLVVGCPDNEFIAHYSKLHPEAEISNYQVHYAHHLASSQRYANVFNQYSAQYQNKTDQKHDLAIIYFPKSKPEFNFLMAMLTPTLAENATILVVGENKGGVKSAQKLAVNYIAHGQKVDSARHCTLFSFSFNNQAKPFDINSWYKEFTIKIANIELNISSLPGVFNSGSLDVGTQLLLENLPTNLTGKILDFGCGAGIIGAYIKKKHPNTDIDLLDVNAFAIASAEQTLLKNKLTGNVFASDGLSNVVNTYKTVVSNPPFHQGIKTNYHTTEAFLKDIKKYLLNQGELIIVANSFLRYTPIMKSELGEPKTLVNSKGFAIHYCQKR